MANGQVNETPLQQLLDRLQASRNDAERTKALRKLIEELFEAEARPTLAEELLRAYVSADEQRRILRRRLTKPVRVNLYEVTRYLREDVREILGAYLEEVYVFLQDPLVASVDYRLGVKPVEVRWEPGVADGPTGSRLAVVDYNGDTGTLVPPARWNEKLRRFESPDHAPLGPKQRTLNQFHQVNVWAVAQRALDMFEAPDALGRPVPWGTGGNRLILVPHAGYGENAYYDRQSKSLQFYYYGTPSEPKYTCLSHDIVAHETGHALLDGVRPYYFEFSSVQTAAFHEFIADLTAILTALRNNDIRGATADQTGGDLTRENAIASLAEEFGEHVTGIRKLRDALNSLTMEQIEGNQSPHECSLVLTGAVYEILVGIAHNYIEEARSPVQPDANGNVPEGEEETPAVGGPTPGRALWWAAQRIIRMVLQPLDFLPPVDVQFVDYARAVLRNFEVYEPADSPRRGFYRDLIRGVFHRRKLCPRPYEECEQDPSRCTLYGGPLTRSFRWDVYHSIEAISGSRVGAYLFLHDNRKRLRIPAQLDLEVADVYDTSKLGGNARRFPIETVVEYVWREEFELVEPEFGPLQGKRAALLCGGTLVLDRRGNLLSWAHKPGALWDEDRAEGLERLARLKGHIARLVRDRMVGMRGDTEVEVLGGWTPPVVADIRTGALRLEITPPMRDQVYRPERPTDQAGVHPVWDRREDRWTTSF